MGAVSGWDSDLYPNKEIFSEFSSANGIQYDGVFLGLGIGIRKWDREWSTDFLFPLFGSLSLDLWKGKNTLFLHLELGHQFGSRRANMFGHKEAGSFFAAYGLGYDWSVSEQLKLYLKASVCHQLTKASGPYSGLGPSIYPEPYDPRYLFFQISLGVRIH
jgi:hypothetical protein